MSRDGSPIIDFFIDSITWEFIGYMVIIIAVIGVVILWKIGLLGNENIGPQALLGLVMMAIVGVLIVYVGRDQTHI